MPGLSAQEELILLRKRARRRLVGAVVLVLLATAVLWRVLGRVEELPMKPESVLIVGESASGALATTPASPAAPAEAVEATPPVDASRGDGTVLPESLSTVNAPLPVAAAPVPSKPEASSASKAKVHTAPAPTPAQSGPAPALSQPETPAPAPTPVSKPHKKKVDPAAILAGLDDGADSTTSGNPAPAANGERFVIQLAALSDPVKADALRSKLKDLGVDAHFSKVKTSKGDATRVRVGPFDRRADADAALRKLARLGVTGIIESLPKQ